MVDTFTRNFQLTKPDFNSSPWHAKINDDLDQVDAIMFRQIVANTMTVWANSTEYEFGDIVIDTDATFWLCQIDHTSRAAGTMADDRADNPTYWTAIALSLNPRGAWTNETLYIVGDIVFEVASGITAICRETHTSSAAPNTLEDDSVYWDFIVEVPTPVAADIEFDNAGTSLLAENVQAALEELDVEFVDMSDLVNDISLDLSAAESDIDDLEAADTALDTRLDTLEVDKLKDYIVNGHHMVSQENGSAAGTTTSYFPVDQWSIGFSNGGAISLQQVDAAAPIHSPKAIRATVTTADAAVAAGDYSVLAHPLEGYDVADLLIGTADAKQVTIGFYVKAPAGTYGFAIQNGAANRTWCGTYTIAGGEANTKVRKSVTVQLDTTGTWEKTTGKGLMLVWPLMVGTTFQGAAGWSAGNFLGPAGSFNFMGTIGNVFELSDVSMAVGAVDPGPRPIDYEKTLTKCCRYWYRHSTIMIYESNPITNSILNTFEFPQPMRVTPTGTFSAVTYSNASTLTLFTSSATSFTAYIIPSTNGQAFVTFTLSLTARM